MKLREAAVASSWSFVMVKSLSSSSLQLWPVSDAGGGSGGIGTFRLHPSSELTVDMDCMETIDARFLVRMGRLMVLQFS